ncbi:MAG: hypothetical protein A2Y73_05465 [Chloroflexi bacterium RBG_13_56_8]|nr:MAG: hypothetical protein A2Y73_05465 [Chloroflexi bacterium RBG_13_56_8]
MRRCVTCVLPETFPSVSFDEAGVCNYCRQYEHRQPRLESQRETLRERFEKLLEEVRGLHAYDCLMAWSGGKDSTYTLLVLRENYDLNVLAYTFDNGFVSPTAFENMTRVSAQLGVDHMIVRPRFDLLRKVFWAAAGDQQPYHEKTLTRASAVCTTCMNLAKGIALRIALTQNIPLIAYGWSPGQAPLTSAIFRRTPEMTRSMIEALAAPLRSLGGDAVRPYFPEDELLAELKQAPCDIHPLAFLDYDEEKMIQAIGKLGWRRPLDTDPNSSNCLLNAYANEVHKKRLGYHPYVMELASLVRQGHLSREEALERLETAEDASIVERIRKTLQP